MRESKLSRLEGTTIDGFTWTDMTSPGASLQQARTPNLLAGPCQRDFRIGAPTMRQCPSAEPRHPVLAAPWVEHRSKSIIHEASRAACRPSYPSGLNAMLHALI